MSDDIYVNKRNGTTELFDIDKVNNILIWATEGINDVNMSDIILRAKLNITNGIETEAIHKILIDAAVNCFTEQYPNYQWVASRLVNFALRKEVWGGINPPKFYDFLNKVIKAKMYDSIILSDYTQSEINKLDEYIKHDRDFDLTYAGIQQLCDKYLVQNRNTKEIYETPQFAYMSIAMTIFRNYSGKDRIMYIKALYDAFSKFKINLPTPQMAGIRTPMRAYSSCTLIDVDDTMKSIMASNTAIGFATSQRYGIGLNIGRMRGIGAEIRNGEVKHTGLIPFLKMYEATTKSCHQNGIRGGGATVSIPIWHYEIEDVIPLKNNGGTEENRVRKLDYTIQLSKLFYERFKTGEDITLFSPHEVPDLYDAFGTPEFDDLYKRYEISDKIKMKRIVSSKDLLALLVKERVETGRIYIMNIDHANAHSSWNLPVKMSNLCVTGDTRLATEFGLVKAIDLYHMQQPLSVTVDNRTLHNDYNNKGVSYLPSTQMHCTDNLAPVFQISTDKGYSLKTTPNHDIYIAEPYRTAQYQTYHVKKIKVKDLKAGDRLMIQSGEGQFGNQGDYDLGFVAGLLAGDGTFADNRQKRAALLELHNNELDLIEDVVLAKDNVVQKYNHLWQDSRAYKPNYAHKLNVISPTHAKYRIVSTKIYDILNEFDINENLKTEVPEFFFRGTKECIIGYLRGLYTADGCVVQVAGKPHLQLTSIAKEVLEGVQLLLSNFGIISNISPLTSRPNVAFEYTTVDGEHRKYTSKTTYRLDITGEHVKRFSDNIGLLGKKQKKLQSLLAEVKHWNKDIFVKVESVDFHGYEDVFDVTQPKSNSVIFNGLVSGQCVEILHPTIPIQDINDPDGEIGVCVLSAVDWLRVKDEKDMEKTCELIVRMLDEIIDHQSYYCPAAEKFTKTRRSLGIGVNNLAAWLAHNKLKYTDKEAPNAVAERMEMQQYYLLKASVKLAQEKGQCEKYDDTKYAQGLLPIDTYKTAIDSVITQPLKMDWEALRQDIHTHGLRHSTLSAVMPCESSSVISNATNGIEPPRQWITPKSSKSGTLPVMVPGYDRYKQYYTLAYDIKNNIALLNISAAIVKFLDMAASTNIYYRYEDYPDGEIPDIDIIKHTMYAYKMGLPTLYYCNTDDASGDYSNDNASCDSGACTI